MRHRHTAQLRWSDPDLLGHVNHARLLSLVEDARMAWLAESPTVSAEHGRHPRGIILARLEVDYVAQVRYRVGESLPVESWIANLGTRSLNMRQQVSHDDRVARRLDGVCVAFDYDADASRPFDDEERAYWSTYLEDAQ